MIYVDCMYTYTNVKYVYDIFGKLCFRSDQNILKAKNIFYKINNILNILNVLFKKSVKT